MRTSLLIYRNITKHCHLKVTYYQSVKNNSKFSKMNYKNRKSQKNPPNVAFTQLSFGVHTAQDLLFCYISQILKVASLLKSISISFDLEIYGNYMGNYIVPLIILIQDLSDYNDESSFTLFWENSSLKRMYFRKLCFLKLCFLEFNSQKTHILKAHKKLQFPKDSHPEVICKKGVFQNFEKFVEKFYFK